MKTTTATTTVTIRAAHV